MDWTAIASSFAQGMGSGGAAPTSAVSASPFDASGWAINFGSGSIDTERTAATSNDLGQWLPYVGIAAALLIAYRLTRRNRNKKG